MKKKIAVVGTGYVGLVTGVSLAEIGHNVTCVDIDKKKVNLMRNGESPIYEKGLSELMRKNILEERLYFTTSHEEAFNEADAIYIAVGTPQNVDGTANLTFIESVARNIAENINGYTVVITKSTVPVGTNEYIKNYIKKLTNVTFDVVSNPEFLREGSAIFDTFNGDRIVIGADSMKASKLVEEINIPFNVPIFKTDIRSSEMIKYASNAFLATKISFINEIATLCEKLGADVGDVADGMGKDKRIGKEFLNAGIGYGGSCFPKDTNALIQIAGNVKHEFTLLKAVVEVNSKQQRVLVEKAIKHFGSLKDKNFALLGTAFKPNTDDMREAASTVLVNELLLKGAKVVAYDPVANNTAKSIFPESVTFTDNAEDALKGADAALLVTEWQEFKNFSPQKYISLLKSPVLFDGRNCYSAEVMKNAGVCYYSIGRPSI